MRSRRFARYRPPIIIMRDGILMPGMAMPKLGPPPADPHPNRRVQSMREAWDLRFIAWEGIRGRRRHLCEKGGGYHVGGGN